VGRHKVDVSNPDKVFFPEPGLTKGDLVDYYLDVAECALPHLRRRPFHMKRFPNGVDGEFFHQKRVPAKHPDYVDEVPVSLMDEVGLPSFPKTSGATGLHILAPIRPELRFPDVRRFAKALAEEVERRVGDQRVATTTWRVAERVGVFVDFGQNARDRTIASAYSVRPVPDARVSAPLRWGEVAEVDPAAFTVPAMRDRIAAVGDPMRGMWRRAVSLSSRFEALGLDPPRPDEADTVS
jgi:DNA primase